MKSTFTRNAILIIGTFLLLFSACTPQSNQMKDDATAQQVAEVAPLLDVEMDTDQLVNDDGIAFDGYVLPDDLEVIEAENINEINWLGSIHPKTPPYFAMSSDGEYFASGTAGRLTILDVSTGTKISESEIEFPNCAYGFERFFQFSHDGSFIAVITKTAIQVLQTGGGLIYESPHIRSFGNGNPSCGFDIPQMGLSPDGKLLAVSGINYSAPEPKRFFRVINVIENETVFEWGGKDDALNGNLTNFPGLGFSRDGEFIQTFDPRQFILLDGDLHQSFRFWSTETWKEVTNLKLITASFEPGDLLFPLSDSGHITILNKLDGKPVAEIPGHGCEWDAPCELVFSNDGSKALLLPREGSQTQFRQSIFYPSLEIWDIENNELIESIQGAFRNLDGLSVTNTGDLIGHSEISNYFRNYGVWWSYPGLFQGLLNSSEGGISFVPTWAEIELEDDCRFCATCKLDIESGFINCKAGIENGQGVYSIRLIDDEWWLVKHNPGGEGKVGKLSLQPAGEHENLRLRLFAFSEDTHTAFYCLDADYRPQTCVIDDFGKSQLLEEFVEMSFLRMSPDGKFTAFLDSSRNTLYIFNLDSQKLSRRSHYQARAAIVNPVFSKDGRTLYYLVENLKNKNEFSVEVLDVIDQKVIKRFSLGADINLPIALAINQSEDLMAVANSNGNFVLFSIEQPKNFFRYQTSQNKLIGIGFGLNDRSLVVLDDMGNHYLWGIEQ